MSVVTGTLETLRFAFPTRELTATELSTFLAGGGLPAGVGYDPASVKFEYEPPGGALVSEAATRDAAGAYHGAVTCSVEGNWRWRGVGLNAEGHVVSSTPWYEFTVGEGKVGTVAELVASVLEDGQFDATEQQVLRWLNDRHRQMVARTRCYRKTLDLGTTIAGQSMYPLPPGIIEMLQVTVGGYVYGAARHNDFAEGELGYVWLGGGVGGVQGREDSASGQQLLRIFPAPTPGSSPEPGGEISVYAAMQPPLLVVGQDTTIKVPDDYLLPLAQGAIATGMLLMESRPDIAAPHEAAFNTGCGELLRATNRKYRGTGPARIRVIGINA